MPLLKSTAMLLPVLDTIIGFAAVPMLSIAIGALRVMPPVVEVEVNTGAVMPEGIIEKILPSLEVRVISLAVMSLTMVMSPISAVIEIAPVVFTVPGSRVFRLIPICD